MILIALFQTRERYITAALSVLRVFLCCKLYPMPFPTRSSVTERTPTGHRPTSTPGFQACWCRHSAISPANYRLTAAVLGAASPTRCQGRAWRRCIEQWRSIVKNRLIPDHRWNHQGVSSRFLMKSFDDLDNGRIPFVARKFWDVKRSRVFLSIGVRAVLHGESHHHQHP